MLLRQARVKLQAQRLSDVGDLDQILAQIESRLSRPSPDQADQNRHSDELLEHIDKPLPEFMSKVHSLTSSESRMVFVCDQFEELFVHYADTPELDEFIGALGEVWGLHDLPVHFLFSMREEWVGSMIAFRKVIPDIFSNYFKLTPLRRDTCRSVLELPAKSRGMVFDSDAVDKILIDLAENYSMNARKRSAEVHFARSSEKDPFIELPALQVVLDRLWQTRAKHKNPFTLAHYESLGGGDTASEPEIDTAIREEGTPKGSPAKNVLDNYMTEMLDGLRDARTYPASVWKDLRIDTLYLLTDKTRHRRALVESRLIEELNQIRPTELDLPRVDSKLLGQVLRPLIEVRLVQVETTVGDENQYELAHDFAVRSVVAAWRQIDRRRTGQLALQARLREEQKADLEKLSDAQKGALRTFLIVPTVAAAVMFVAIVWILESPGDFFNSGLTPFGWIMTSAATYTLVTGIARRVRLHIILGALFVACTLILLVDAQNHEGSGYDHARADFLIFTLPLGFWYLFFFPLNIMDVLRRLNGSLALRRMMSIMWAELVDIAVMAGLLVLVEASAGAIGIAGVLALVVVLAKTGKTPGFGLGGFEIRRSTGDPVGFLRALFRQLALFLWGAPVAGAVALFIVMAEPWYDSSDLIEMYAVACALWLPWLIISPNGVFS